MYDLKSQTLVDSEDGRVRVSCLVISRGFYDIYFASRALAVATVGRWLQAPLAGI